MNTFDREHAAYLAERIEHSFAAAGMDARTCLGADTIDWLATSTRSEVLLLLETHRLIDDVFPYLPRDPEDLDCPRNVSPLLHISRVRMDTAATELAGICVADDTHANEIP